MLNRPGSADTSSVRAAAITRARVSSIAAWRWPRRYGRGLIYAPPLRETFRRTFCRNDRSAGEPRLAEAGEEVGFGEGGAGSVAGADEVLVAEGGTGEILGDLAEPGLLDLAGVSHQGVPLAL